MKKILAIVLALVMLLAVSVPAFAADVTITDESDPKTGEAVVRTSTQNEDGEEAAGFTVSIPAENIVPWDATSTDFQYTVTSQLAPNKAVRVDVDDPTGDLLMTDANGLTLAYWIQNSFAVMDGPVVDAQACTFTVCVDSEAWNAAPVSEYSDTLLFTASIVDVQAETP